QRTRPYMPRHNGKVERYQRILSEECLYAHAYYSEAERREAISIWVHHYNYHRTHTACADQPPSSRVHERVDNVMTSYSREGEVRCSQLLPAVDVARARGVLRKGEGCAAEDGVPAVQRQRRRGLAASSMIVGGRRGCDVALRPVDREKGDTIDRCAKCSSTVGAPAETLSTTTRITVSNCTATSLGNR